MAKKLSEIKNIIESKEIQFLKYLKENIDEEILNLINELNSKTDVYIFSGIIRNFFLGISEFRDIDIILDSEINIEDILIKKKFRKNSFGGYKINLNNIEIDLWYLRNTWALNNYQTYLDIELPASITSTTFFNFSSIMYSLKKNKFIYSIDFMRFLRDKNIEIVLHKNPNVALCIVNSFYYSEKFNLKIGSKLNKFIQKEIKKNTYDFELVQIKHFNEIKYQNEEIIDKIKLLNKI